MVLLAGNDMIGALGAEIDRLEYEIQQAVPGIRHIDLVRLAAHPSLYYKTMTQRHFCAMMRGLGMGNVGGMTDCCVLMALPCRRQTEDATVKVERAGQACTQLKSLCLISNWPLLVARRHTACSGKSTLSCATILSLTAFQT